MEEAHEWDIFKRLEKIEAIELGVKDAGGIALAAFLLSFAHSAGASDNPRKVKDTSVLLLEIAGVSPEALKILEKLMLSICEIMEKERK